MVVYQSTILKFVDIFAKISTTAMFKKQTRRLKNKRNKKRAILVILVAISCLLITGVLLKTIGTDPTDEQGKNSVNDAQTTKNGSTDTNKQSQDELPSSSSKNVPSDSKSNPSTTSTVVKTPRGTFVSNHSPRLSDKNQNAMSSTCITTPNVNCQITFTKGSTIIMLPSIKTNSEGAAYWDWKLDHYNFSVGTWTIRAIATLNNSQKSATDALKLEVRQ